MCIYFSSILQYGTVIKVVLDQSQYQTIIINMSSISMKNRKSSLRYSTEAEDKDSPHKYNFHNLKKSQQLHLNNCHPLKLPEIRTRIHSSTYESRSFNRSRLSRLKSSIDTSIPDCYLVIKQEGKPPSKLKPLFQQFNQNHKNLKFIADISLQLQDSNPFFKKLDQVLICCFLKCSVVKQYNRGNYIYNKGDESKQFYIILEGKVVIQSKKQFFKKVCKPGESLSEEVVLSDKGLENTNSKIEYAKACSQVFLLQIKSKHYNRLCVELTLRGMKHCVQTLESILIRNYLTKASIRKARFI